MKKSDKWKCVNVDLMLNRAHAVD